MQWAIIAVTRAALAMGWAAASSLSWAVCRCAGVQVQVQVGPVTSAVMLSAPLVSTEGREGGLL